MGKIKIISATDSGRKWEGKDIIEVTAMDGNVEKKGSCFDRKILDFIGKEVEMDVKEGKEYQGVMRHYFNFPKDAKAGGFPKKDYAFEKRRVALECAVQSTHLSQQEVLKIAEEYLTWLNK